MDRGDWQATAHGIAKVGHDLELSFASPHCAHMFVLSVLHVYFCPADSLIFTVFLDCVHML